MGTVHDPRSRLQPDDGTSNASHGSKHDESKHDESKYDESKYDESKYDGSNGSKSDGLLSTAVYDRDADAGNGNGNGNGSWNGSGVYAKADADAGASRHSSAGSLCFLARIDGAASCLEKPGGEAAYR